MSESSDIAWNAIFKDNKIGNHDFNKSPFVITAKQIKQACNHFGRTSQTEPRILCKQDTRESRPSVFQEKGLFLLPVKNGEYSIIKGEGYVDIPPITSRAIPYFSKLDFHLESACVGNSEMQHLDYAYAVSLVRSFLNDDSLVLTIRGRKYTPAFDFRVGKHRISTTGVQTEVDSGYEGRDRIVLIEAKNCRTNNTIIRQLYYPYRQWSIKTGKSVSVLFFEKRKLEYHFWEFYFEDENDYNSIKLKQSKKFIVSDLT